MQFQAETLAYRQALSQGLHTLVKEFFKAPTDSVTSKQVELLYPIELQAMAADAGHKLALPINTTVTFLVIMHSSRIKESSRFSGWWARFRSTRARHIYNAHCKMLDNSNGLSVFWDKDLIRPFNDELMHQFFVQAKHLPLKRLRELRYLLGIPDEPSLGLWSTAPQ